MPRAELVIAQGSRGLCYSDPLSPQALESRINDAELALQGRAFSALGSCNAGLKIVA